MRGGRSGAGGRPGHAGGDRSAQATRALGTGAVGTRELRAGVNGNVDDQRSTAAATAVPAPVVVELEAARCRSTECPARQRHSLPPDRAASSVGSVRAGAAVPELAARATGRGAGLERFHPARAAQGACAHRSGASIGRGRGAGAADPRRPAVGTVERSVAAHALRPAGAADPDLRVADAGSWCAAVHGTAGRRQDNDTREARCPLRTRAGRRESADHLDRRRAAGRARAAQKPRPCARCAGRGGARRRTSLPRASLRCRIAASSSIRPVPPAAMALQLHSIGRCASTARS